MVFTPRRSIRELAMNQDGTTVFNSSNRRLEQGAGFSNVIDTVLTTPPVSPAEGDAYFIPNGGTGAWLGNINDVGYFENGEWKFVPSIPGDLFYDITAGAYYRWTGSAIKPVSTRDFELGMGSPTSSENRLVAFFAESVEVVSAMSAVEGSTPSVTWNFRYAPNRFSAGTNLNSSNYVVTTTQSDSGPTNTTIPAGNWLWVQTFATSGTVTDFWASIRVFDRFL